MQTGFCRASPGWKLPFGRRLHLARPTLLYEWPVSAQTCRYSRDQRKRKIARGSR